MSLKTLVVDDHELVRRGIKSVLATESGLEVVGEADCGLDAISRATEFRPDLVLLDISLPDINGIQVATSLRESCPASKILFLSQHDSIHIAQAALNTGAHGFVVKADAALELLKAIHTVQEGKIFLSDRLLAANQPMAAGPS